MLYDSQRYWEFGALKAAKGAKHREPSGTNTSSLQTNWSKMGAIIVSHNILRALSQR